MGTDDAPNLDDLYFDIFTDDTDDGMVDVDPPHVRDSYGAAAAEMRGLARCARAYFRTLLAGPFERDEAWQLVRDWHASYWDAQHAPLRNG